jgi:hypothetical protein
MLVSNAYRALTPNARSLLVELIMLYNGDNNGSLYLSVRDATHRIGLSDVTAGTRAFDELLQLGFIELAQDAHFRVKAAEHSRARCWRLTWLQGPGRKLPEWQFLDQEPPPGSVARRRMERGLRVLKTYRRARDTGHLPVLDSNTQEQFGAGWTANAVADSNTLYSRNGGFPPVPIIRDSATHIATTIGRCSEARFSSWWEPDWSTLAAAVVVFSRFGSFQNMRKAA